MRVNDKLLVKGFYWSEDDDQNVVLLESEDGTKYTILTNEIVSCD